MLAPLLGGDNMAEATLSLALPYLVFVLGEKVFGVSGVVAVVSAGLTVGVLGSARLAPDNWRYLERVWDQIGFWASSLIFVSATMLVPRLLVGGSRHDIWLLAIVNYRGACGTPRLYFLASCRCWLYSALAKGYRWPIRRQSHGVD